MKYELKKLFQSKLLLIAILIVLLYSLFSSYQFIRFQFSSTGKEYAVARKKVYNTYTGGYSQNDLNSLNSFTSTLSDNISENSPDTQDATFWAYLDLQENISNLQECEAFRNRVLTNTLSETSDSYLNRLNQKAYKAYSHELSLTIYDTTSNYELTALFYTTTYVFVLVLFLMSLAVVRLFITDHETHIYVLIYSSPKGRIYQLFCKLWSLFLFGSVTIIITTLCPVFFVVLANGTPSRLFEPIQSITSLVYSPYNINFLEFIIIATLLRILGCMVFTVLSVIITLFFQKSLFPTIILSFLNVGLYTIYTYYQNNKIISGYLVNRYNTFQYLRKFSFIVPLYNPFGYLEKFECINVFGFPVSILTINITINLVFIGTLILLGIEIAIKRFRRNGTYA